MSDDAKALNFIAAKEGQEKAKKRSEGMAPVTEMVGSDFDFYKADMKTGLMEFITSVVSDIKQTKAAEMLGITQAQVSLIRNKRISQFSVDKLIEIAWKAGYGMELHPVMVSDIANQEENSSDEE